MKRVPLLFISILVALLLAGPSWVFPAGKKTSVSLTKGFCCLGGKVVQLDKSLCQAKKGYF